MTFLRFIVLAAVFIVLLFISLQNAQPVTLQFFNVATWQAPLVFVILVAFAAGVALGLLASAIQLVKLKRQLAKVRREHQRANTLAVQHAPDTLGAPGAPVDARSSRTP
jgi:lipopolysaccharide assembly protein A